MVSVCRVLGFGLNDPIFGGLGFPRSIANGKDARYPLGGPSQYLAGYQGQMMLTTALVPVPLT